MVLKGIRGIQSVLVWLGFVNHAEKVCHRGVAVICSVLYVLLGGFDMVVCFLVAILVLKLSVCVVRGGYFPRLALDAYSRHHGT